MNRTRLFSSCAACLVATCLPSVAHADVTVGPRFSYYIDNSNLRTADLDGLQESRRVVNDQVTQDLRVALPNDDIRLTEIDNGNATNANQVTFPMIGAMINFGDDRDRFTIAAMYGSGSTTSELISSRELRLRVSDVSFNEISLIETVNDSDIERIDVEMTWQRRLNENFAISGGVRYERLDTTGSGVVTISDTDGVRSFITQTLGQVPPNDNLDVARRPQRIGTSSDLELFSARLGVTAFVPFSDDAVAFFNGNIQAGYQPSSRVDTEFLNAGGDVLRSETRMDSGELSLGPDFAVGVQFTLSEDVALDIRYRAIVFFPLSGDFSFSDTRVNHGVNLGVSLRL